MIKFINADQRKTFIEEMIKTEWKMFQKVNNIDGRASCQDEWGTFHIMRFSQYSSWPDELIKSYGRDLDAAVKVGRNIVMEKYAYMMEFNSMDYYTKKLEPFLPKVDINTMIIIKEITSYMVTCDKEFANTYPKLGNAGRAIESGVNLGGVTSVETYAIGELKTYSIETLRIYLDFVRKNRAEGNNMVLIEKESMVKMSGFSSLEDAESKMV